MMKKAMFFLEVLITWFAMRTVGSSVYGKFANKLGLKDGQHVLDFGCGLGTVAIYVAPLIRHGRLVCADISNQRLNQCKKKLKHFKQVEYINLQSGPYPLQPNTFDLIYCHYVLHELTEEQLATTLRKMFLWMKPRGALVFREPADDTAFHRHLDAALPASGFKKESTTITDIPLMGNAIEGRFLKMC